MTVTVYHSINRQNLLVVVENSLLPDMSSNHDDDSRDETKQSNGQHSSRDWKGM